MRITLLLVAATLAVGIPTVDSGRRPLGRAPQPLVDPAPSGKVWFGGTLPPVVITVPAATDSCPATRHQKAHAGDRATKRGSR
ncbi:MAG TPA: hypothetical protein VMH88_06605 [Gemmatimonadales bacterium]|nr:hypothetical protein [Gemmatimonadales bacterium]